MTRKSSELGYYVRGLPAKITSNAPVDVGAARFGVVNNLNHLQDEMGQHAGTMCKPASPGFGSAYWTQATTTLDTFARMDGMPPIFTFLRAQNDGSSARLQVTLSAYCSTAGKTATFRVFLRPFVYGMLPTPAPVDAAYVGPVVDEQSTSSGTVVTLRSTLYVGRLTDEWITAMPSLDGTGAVAEVRFYAGMVEAWGTTDDVTAHPVITGISVREFVG